MRWGKPPTARAGCRELRREFLMLARKRSLAGGVPFPLLLLMLLLLLRLCCRSLCSMICITNRTWFVLHAISSVEIFQNLNSASVVRETSVALNSNT